MDFAQRTIDIARRNVEQGGRPFATVIVKDGAILAESPNLIAQASDPPRMRRFSPSARPAPRWAPGT